jgi:uncharacterized protein (UPF0276 family)
VLLPCYLSGQHGDEAGFTMRSTTPAPSTRLGLPDLGVGVGLRIPHYREIFEEGGGRGIDWLEIISENFMVGGGMPLYNLDRALERFPVVQHGVSLSIGSTDPLDRDYLRKLKALVQRTRSPWVSDHICWGGASGVHLHDLLPMPYTAAAVRWVAERARAVADVLGVRFVLENVSSYMTYKSSEMTEWEFLSAVAEEADCGILLDVNNIYVSSYNHGFDPVAYVDGVPHGRVVQVHLAGHTNHGKYILDTHNDHVIDPVWDLYRRAIERVGPVSTLIEWDADIPPFAVLEAEAAKARAIRDEALGGV